jgi:hypothetical protein
MRALCLFLGGLAFLYFCGYALLHPFKARRIWQEEAMAERPNYNGRSEKVAEQH